MTTQSVSNLNTPIGETLKSAGSGGLCWNPKVKGVSRYCRSMTR